LVLNYDYFVIDYYFISLEVYVVVEQEVHHHLFLLFRLPLSLFRQLFVIFFLLCLF